MKKIFLTVLTVAFVFAGCSSINTQIDNTEPSAKTASTEAESAEATVNTDMFSNRDFEIGYDEKECVNIILNGTGAASDSNDVIINNNTITVKNEGVYIVSGELTDGMIIIDADDTDKPQIVLNNAKITSATSAAIYVKNADKVFITLSDNSENSLTNGGEFISIDENNIDGAFFSKDDVTFNGNGSLKITSPAGHGIVCKDDAKFTSGKYDISSAYHGIDANDSVRITNANIEIASGKDGIHIENSEDDEKGYLYYMNGSLNISAEGDGISAGGHAKIEEGAINIIAGGGSENGAEKSSDNYGFFGGGAPDGERHKFDKAQHENDTESDATSMKGIKSGQRVDISGGNFTIDSADDSIHSNGIIVISGGTFELQSGDDGIHADESITITGGAININESYEGIEALDIIIGSGDIKIFAQDDGINAAGGKDESGFGGRDNAEFGGDRGDMMNRPEAPDENFDFRGFNDGKSNGSIHITGSNIYIEASGDGIDANGDLIIEGGYICVCGPTVGDTAVLDYDNTATISGGTFIGTGAMNMAQSFSDAENQGVLALNVGSNEAETKIKISSTSEKVILEIEPNLPYELLIFSSPEIKTGEECIISIGEESFEAVAS